MAMIENSDRGITLNKSFAWTMACGLVGAGLWVGIQVATLRGETAALSQTINGLRVDLTASEARHVATIAGSECTNRPASVLPAPPNLLGR